MAIKSEISLDSSKAEAEATRAGASIANKLAKSSQGTGGKGFFSGAESGLTKLNSGVSLLRQGFQAVSNAVDFADNISDLKDRVASVLPATADVNAEMEKLARLAESPGLEFESVAKAHASFLSLGKSSEESVATIRELGNALQLSGADPKQLNTIVGALTKMDDAGRPNIKILHSLAEESVAFRQAFKAGFGTESVSDIEALGLSGDQFFASFTAGLRTLKTAQKDAADSLGDYKDRAKRFSADIVDNIISGTGMILEMVGLGDKAQTAPARSKESPEDAEARQEEIRKANKLRIIGLQEADELENKLAISKLREKEGTEAERAAQKKITDELTLKLRLQKDLNALMKSQQISAEAATDLIERQVENARALNDEQEKLANSKKKVNQEEDLAKRKRDADIMDAKSKGHGGKAERLQKAANLADKQKELEGLGMSPADAKKRAAEEVRISEDAAFREKTGRSRTHQGGHRGMDGLGPRSASDVDKFGDERFPNLGKMGRTQPSRTYAPGATTKLTANEITGTQSGGNSAAKAMEGLTAALKNLEQAAKKYNSSNLNSN